MVLKKMSEEDSKDKINLKEVSTKVKKVLSNKKILLGITLVLFTLILFTSVNMRLQNLESLKDATTGKYLPSDPDACYELRVAQTLLDNGNIGGIDAMRNPGLNISYTQEMLPKALVASYKFITMFNPKITLDLIDVLYPTVAFAISLIFFFILCWYVTKSKFVGVVASAILAYSPSYLSRTSTGVSSHEALGMIFFFLALLLFIFSLNNYKKKFKFTGGCGVLTGASIGLSVLSWSGASNFIIMIVPVTLIFHYFFNEEIQNLKTKKKFILFNLTWIVSSILVMPLFSNSFSVMYNKFITNYGVIIPAIILFSIVDFLLETYQKKLSFLKIEYKKKRLILAVAGTVILGLLGLILIGRNPLQLIYGIYHQLLFPMGQGRVALTVSYYSQPYLQEVIAQYSPIAFWMFIGGIFCLGVEFSKKINSKKKLALFFFLWIVSFIGLIFTRYSTKSVFQGTNFISQVSYFLSFLIFGSMLIFLYLKKNGEIKNENLFLLAWVLIMVLSLRSAVRVLFLVFSFVALMMPYFIFKVFEYSKKSKEEAIKPILIIGSLVLVITLFFYLFGNPIIGTYGTYQITEYSAKMGGSIAGTQWQDAMEWVRTNTNSDDVFIHWWDYGYLIQLMANRTTVLDGGNANGYWNHLMGRYVLTTPKPETALSFMKTHNVSYLLIDPTDLGKYGAYSKIGSDDNWDRFAYLESFFIDEAQTVEKPNSTLFVYTGVTGVDEDLVINDGETIIPGPTYDKVGNPSYKAYIAGIIEETSSVNNKTITPSQPIAVIIYKNKQINVPMRYLYSNGKIIDYKTGIDSIFFVYPYISGNSVNAIGAGIYLSPKVSKGLFSRLYLMNDPFNEYATVKLAKTQSSEVVSSLKEQGLNLGEFVYYNGFQAPLKIWKMNYSENVLINPNFMKETAGYAEFDNDKFTK